MMKKGDRVLVWSLQSFSNGGFLKAEPAFLRQSQNGDSVLLCVIRNFGGEYKIDKGYEVYGKQVELVTKHNWKAKKILKRFRKEILANKYIS
jgi:hypothetical protein